MRRMLRPLLHLLKALIARIHLASIRLDLQWKQRLAKISHRGEEVDIIHRLHCYSPAPDSIVIFPPWSSSLALLSLLRSTRADRRGLRMSMVSSSHTSCN